MAEITLVAETGRPTGSAPARRLRAEGRIPAVIYGEGVAPQAVSVVARDLRAALSTDAGLNVVLSLRVGPARYVAMARELQRHPVRGTVQHVDFQVVDPDQTITAEVPVIAVGDPVMLHRADGILDQQLFHLVVRARPGDIPNQFELDVTDLGVGQSLRVDDLVLPDGVTTDVDPEVVVVHGQPPRIQTGEEGGEAGAEGTEAGSDSTASESGGEG
jgi:large subunit ribosomal protein L25